MSVTITVKRTKQLLKNRNLLIGQGVQVFIDSEVVRRMAPYTPFESGTLRDSPYAFTRFGSGVVVQSTPYARRQYYTVGYRHRGMATHHWFEAMKSHGGVKSILSSARRLAGAKQ